MQPPLSKASSVLLAAAPRRAGAAAAACQPDSPSPRPEAEGKMDPGPSLGSSLKDVKWSAVAVPLDQLVSTYRLPQLVRLDSGE